MASHIIMDGSGDKRHEFDVTDALAVTLAEQRFNQLMGRGYRAVALGKNGGTGRVLGRFDPEVEETLFIPQLQGG